ncbi:MAG: aromatic amino acid transaminase, partial [Myxococcota bacterium]
MAERRLIEQGAPKTYLPIAGNPTFGAQVRALLFGDDTLGAKEGRAVTAQTPGGTGALRVAADLLARHAPGCRVFVSDPTWENHVQIFAAASVNVVRYPYYEKKSRRLDEEGMLAALANADAGDVVLLHGCCHNPSGVDPSEEMWRAIAKVCADRRLVPLIDLAYQGFGDGLEEDVRGLRSIVNECPEVFVASSYSKNFGLYCERVGALTLVAENRDAADRALSQLKVAVRTNYSNPPRHGAAIVEMILGDADLRRRWEEELTTMRARIKAMREGLVAGLAAARAEGDYSGLLQQRGMFSFSGLSPSQVDALREDFAIYAVRSGRINVAGITDANLAALCEAIADVSRR